MFIIQIVGLVVVAFFAIYFALAVIYALSGKKPEPILDRSAMPLLRPLPIATKNRPFIMRVLAWLFDVRHWQLMENWQYKLPDNNEIVLHKGFIFDGASIPRPLWSFLSPVGLLLIPGLIHDYGYRYAQLWKKDGNGDLVPYSKNAKRKYWDRLFRDVGKKLNGIAIVDYVA